MGPKGTHEASRRIKGDPGEPRVTNEGDDGGPKGPVWGGDLGAPRRSKRIQEDPKGDPRRAQTGTKWDAMDG